MIDYHDREWGVPVHDDRVHFEFLTLEGAQAGLSWETVLRKRARYREVFAGFEPAVVARFSESRITRLGQDAGIIRNAQKIRSTVSNAKAFLRVQEDFGSFDAFIWQFVDGIPLRNHWRRSAQAPAKTALSDAISKDLRKRGFSFVGSTICYSFMQAVGLVDDHIVSCLRSRP